MQGNLSQAVPTLLMLMGLSRGLTLTYFYGDGSYFVGDVDKDGRPEKGVFYQDGVIRYYGSYKEGHYHGEGSWYGEGGESYQGEFRGGQASGRGVFTKEEAGERVAGQFENNMVSGRAVWHIPFLGLKLEGLFLRGYAHGPAVVTWNNSGLR